MAVRPSLYLCLAACVLYTASAAPTTVTSTEQGTTAEPEFFLNLHTTARKTNFVNLVWEEPNEEVLGYRIRCKKDDSEDLITSPMLSPASTEYFMDNLMPDSTYDICVRAATNDVKQPESNKKAADAKDDDDDDDDDDDEEEDNLIYNEEECIKASTIPYIRRDSVLAVCIAIGYILLMCIIGYICWAWKKAKIEAAMEEEEEEEEPEEEKIMPDSYRPAYVAPTTGPAVRSSIEEHPDIPYITPPVAQLSKTDKQAYNAKV